MKKIILFLFISVIVTGTILLVSFKANNAKPKHFTNTCYYYVCGTCSQLVAPGTSGQTDCRLNTLLADDFKDVDDWTTTSNSPSLTADTYIASICFDMETNADGGCDGQLTLQEALNAVWNYYVNHSFTLPTDGGTITECTAVITIRRKSAVC